MEPLNIKEDVKPKGRWHQFTQQRLRAWQMILSPGKVVALFMIVGVVFVGIGILLLMASEAIVEMFQDYSEKFRGSSELWNSTKVGYFDMTVQRDMEPPIWVHYQLEGFHQNHRRYIQSRDDLQLRDVDLALKTNPQLSACSPWIQTGTRFNYPCGLVAKSVFNDSYTIIYKERGATNYSHLQVDDSATTIAWAADLAGRYKNLNPEATFGEGQQNQEHFNMWLLERFPPVKCVQVQVSPQNPLVPARVATRVTSTGTRVADCKDYMSSNPTCNFTRNGKPFACSGAYEAQKVKDWGTESGHFITWMRIAGLPTFRKAWGKVNTKLTAGTTLRVYVEDNFPVLPFYGRKALMLSTSSVLIGRNSFLGYGYIAVGGCCLLFGLVFLRHSLAF
ncbi:unnamed protein product [Polarella glacialis]|uniref:Cell cycle control protein 50A n=1 Tax=Polarella glacialis TaxID=89957 RepID=A0A813KQ19_POLGL|nr:unnamed protein product [Polarella glacialis]|eukprot:CAMPEP_0115081518 /NCGR_PEP_ID=MMETSP0227-20121206/19325_1 /TAXON_ID=89957 /ORGANISM="Polarella glacialis, Strain CCMP 1383" /LENGTH=390 /DNA_ID=CAMNT_0002469375 /DNA_START=53 /DNA_END=1225 /DNA_ORIENTATION=+